MPVRIVTPTDLARLTSAFTRYSGGHESKVMRYQGRGYVTRIDFYSDEQGNRYLTRTTGCIRTGVSPSTGRLTAEDMVITSAVRSL